MQHQWLEAVELECAASVARDGCPRKGDLGLLKCNGFREIGTMLLLLCLCVCLGSGCQEGLPVLSEAEIASKTDALLAKIVEDAGLSDRECVFDVQITDIRRGKITLTGETSEQRLKDILFTRIADELSYGIVDEIDLLPSADLGDKTWALVCKPVINLGSAPSKKDYENTVTQARLGDVLRVLKTQDEWYLVQMDDHYLGWADPSDIILCDKDDVDEFWDKEVALIAVKMAECLDSPGGEPVFEKRLVHGSILPIESQTGEWAKLSLPGGGNVYTKTVNILRYKSREDALNKQSGVAAVIATAKQYLGFPYLWGGCTSYGFDCSGFTQFCMKVNGYSIRRDADLQFKQGEPVLTIAQLKPGDLVFFQTDNSGPSHVGIYIGDYRFIHSAGSTGVTINSFKSSNVEEYSSSLTMQFCGGRRIIK